MVRGVRMKDMLTREEWDVRAKVVINATGTSFTIQCIIIPSLTNQFNVYPH